MSDALAVPETIRALSRVFMRTMGHFILDEIARLTDRGDGDFLKGLVELSIIQATRPLAGSGIESHRTISVRAIADSLCLAYETCRRKVMELQADGRCQRLTANRLVMAPGLLESPAYQAECDERWRNLRSYLTELTEIGFDFNAFNQVSPQSMVRAPNLSRAVAALLDDFMLRLMEARVSNEDDITDSNIITAIMTMNGEPVRFDREATWTYASTDTPPPDSLRIPVSLSMVARRLHLTEDLVGRRVKSYCDRGWIQRVPGGYLFVMQFQQTDAAKRSRDLTSQRFLQLIQTLRQMGVDPAKVGRT